MCGWCAVGVVCKMLTMSRAEISDDDRADVGAFIEKFWQGRAVMSRGKKFFPHEEEGFLDRRDGEIVGLLTYHAGEDGMEILTLNSTIAGAGIGTALILSAIEKARELGCARTWLTTTNDRLRAIGFYQRVGFRMVAINLGVVDKARKSKPEIPEAGERGVPIHDEIVMELTIKPYLDSEK